MIIMVSDSIFDRQGFVSLYIGSTTTKVIWALGQFMYVQHYNVHFSVFGVNMTPQAHLLL